MTVVIHNLERALPVTWTVSRCAELGAFLAAQLRAQRREGTLSARDDLERFRGFYDGLRSLIFYTDAGGSEDMQEASERVAGLSPQEFSRLTQLTVPAIDPELAEEVRRNSAAVRDRFVAHVRYIEGNAFGQHWERTSRVLEKHVHRARTTLHRAGVVAAIVESIGAARSGGDEGTVIVDKLYDSRIDAAVRPVRLIPTTLNWPQVLVKDETDRVHIHYSLAPTGGHDVTSTADMSGQLAALSRQHSLEILHELAKRPAGTMTLAQRIGADPATISRTLRHLQQASLITVQRDGRQRWYRVNLGEFEAFGNKLWQVITR